MQHFVPFQLKNKRVNGKRVVAMLFGLQHPRILSNCSYKLEQKNGNSSKLGAKVEGAVEINSCNEMKQRINLQLHDNN